MSKEFMNEETLKRLIEKIKAELKKYSKKEDLDKLDMPIVDGFLSETSMNAIANKIVTESIKSINSDISDITGDLSLVQADVVGIQQQIRNHEHFKGYFFTVEELKVIEATPNDYAYVAESGTKWVYTDDLWRDTIEPVPDQLTPPSDAIPLMNGEASIGEEEAYARGDHRHPTDTTRASAAELNTLKSDISTALDAIIAIQETLIGGDA